MTVCARSFADQHLHLENPTHEQTVQAWEDGKWVLWRHPDFPDRSDHLPTGVYDLQEPGPSLDVPYARLHRLRALVARTLHGEHWDGQVPNYESHRLGPWLVYADDEGFFGPGTCGRLAMESTGVEIEPPEGQEYLAEDWATWKAMFDHAAYAGVVVLG